MNLIARLQCTFVVHFDLWYNVQPNCPASKHKGGVGPGPSTLLLLPLFVSLSPLSSLRFRFRAAWASSAAFSIAWKIWASSAAFSSAWKFLFIATRACARCSSRA